MSARHRDTNRTAQPSDVEVLAAAYDIVSIMREFLNGESPGQDIVDEAELPYPRETIVSAFRLAIATEPRRDIRQELLIIGCVLAQYQQDVGARISITPAKDVTKQNEHEAERFTNLNRLFTQVSRDGGVLRTLFARASQIAEGKFERTRFHPPFQDDGTYTPYGHGNVTSKHTSIAADHHAGLRASL